MKDKTKKQEEEKTDMIPFNKAEVPVTQDISKIHLDGYRMMLKALSESPKPEETKINEAAKNSKFIPIGIMENKLDLIYSGLWSTENFRYLVVANEIVGSITLKVFIPGAGWISREGAGAVMIQQKSGSDLSDINAKFKNTLVKDFPHLKSECIKNACKSLGKAFGRDFNREDVGDFNLYYSDSNILENAKADLEAEITPDNVNTIGKEIFERYEDSMNGVEKKKLQDFIRDTKIKIKEGVKK